MFLTAGLINVFSVLTVIHYFPDQPAWVIYAYQLQAFFLQWGQVVCFIPNFSKSLTVQGVFTFGGCSGISSEWIYTRARNGSIHCINYNQVCLPIGVYARFINWQHHLEEPYESRGSKPVPDLIRDTVLWGAGGENPLAYSTIRSCYCRSEEIYDQAGLTRLEVLRPP